MNNIFFLGFITSACENISILKVCYFIKQILSIAFTLIPIAVIVMVSVDLAKNVVSNEEVMKRNILLAFKRILMCIAVFLVPTIVNFTINGLGDFNIGYKKCMQVDLNSIDRQIAINKGKCTEKGYRWDSSNNNCVKEQNIPNINNKELPKQTIISKNSSSSNSEGGSAKGQFKYYNQCDYGYPICGDGCGPTSLAIIATAFSGREVTPPEMYKYIKSLGGLPGGMDWGMATNKDLLKKYNLKVEQIIKHNESTTYDEKKAQAIKNAVDSGKGVLLLIKGHYVVVGPNSKCKSNQVFLYEVGDRDNTKCYEVNKSGLWKNTKHRGAIKWREAYAYSSK